MSAAMPLTALVSVDRQQTAAEVAEAERLLRDAEPSALALILAERFLLEIGCPKRPTFTPWHLHEYVDKRIGWRGSVRSWQRRFQLGLIESYGRGRDRVVTWQGLVRYFAKRSAEVN